MTPDTGSYFVAAYVAAAVLYIGYALTLWRRARALESRRAMHDGRD